MGIIFPRGKDLLRLSLRQKRPWM